MSSFTIRNATLEDVPFLVDTIVEAEKSGTDIFTYTTIFGLNELEARSYITKMLLEEIDGCELSISSFIIAQKDDKYAAAVGAWIEGFEGVSSSMLKGNLLNFTLPKDCIEKAISLNNLVKELHIESVNKTIQIGLVYVASEFRGLGLPSILIEEQLKHLLFIAPETSECYVQVFGNNKPAIRSYEKSNFVIVSEKVSSNKEIINFFPSNIKVLMKRVIGNPTS